MSSLSEAVAELSGGGGGDEDSRSSERDEVQQISDDIRRAIECPVCLLLSPNLTCICPNGHHTCISCIDQLFNNNPYHRCPLCRSPLTNTVEVSPTELKLVEWMSVVRVACAHRRFGCDRFVTVQETVEHELQCAHKPDVQCLVSACPWIGVYRQLYDHVSDKHPNVASEQPNNRLIVNNMNKVLTNRRQTYLVKSPSGLFWVMLSRLALNRIQTSVFMEEERQPGVAPSLDPPAMAYRITRSVTDGRSRTLVRTQFINWTSVLLRNGDMVNVHAFDTNTISVRLQQAKQVYIDWFSINRKK